MGNKLSSFFFLGVIFLTGCIVPMINMDTIAHVDKNMDLESVKSKVYIKPVNEFVLEPKNDYKVLVYNMQTGTRQVLRTHRDPNGLMSMTPTTVPTYEKYFFLFKKEKLIFWGFIPDFKKDDNSEMNRIGSLIQSKMDELHEKAMQEEREPTGEDNYE